MGFGWTEAIAIGSAGLDFLGGSKDRKAAAALNDQNIALQKEFAQNGIRWKVEDAKKAGIHPLYALGANTMSFSPVSSFSESPLKSLASHGQDLSRAFDSTRTTREKLEVRAAELQVERGELENMFLASQIAKLDQPGSGPPGPGDYPAFAVEGAVPRQTRRGIWSMPIDVPAYDEFGNPVFTGPTTVVEPYRRSSHQAFEDYYGDLPSEAWSLGNIGRRIYEKWR